MSGPSTDASAPPPRSGFRDATEALRYRNFALFWTGALISSTGTWVQNVTVPFVIFQLTDSAAWVGFAAFAGMIPAALLSPVGGSLADRFPRRTILIVMQTLQAAVALALWGAWVAGVRSPMVIVALTALSGAIAGLYIGSWQAFVAELVPRDVLHNAVTLNSAQFSAARAFGPAVGGILLAWLGPSSAFFLNALSFMAVIVALAAIRVDPVDETVTRRPHLLAELADTVRYVRRAPGISACMIVVLALGFFGSPVFQFIVVFAEDVFEVGARAFGLLSASLGIGAILGTPFVAGRGARMPRHVLAGGAMVVYGSALLVFALAPVYGVAVVGLLGAGAGYLAIASTLNTTIQLQVDERVRGKVLALYVMALTLSVPLGSLLQGWAADAIGPRITVAVSGGAFLLVAFVLRARGSLLRMDDESAPRWTAPDAATDPAANGVDGP